MKKLHAAGHDDVGHAMATPSKRMIAFLGKHPRGYYWVRDGAFSAPSLTPLAEETEPPEFVAFFTGYAEQAVWLYPGDDLAHGRPYSRPQVVAPVDRALTAKDTRTRRAMDEFLAKVWTKKAPGDVLTRVHAFGRVSLCPGTPEDVEKALRARGMDVVRTHVTRRRNKPVNDQFLEVLSEEGVQFMRDLTSVM